MTTFNGPSEPITYETHRTLGILGQGLGISAAWATLEGVGQVGQVRGHVLGLLCNGANVALDLHTCTTLKRMRCIVLCPSAHSADGADQTCAREDRLGILDSISVPTLSAALPAGLPPRLGSASLICENKLCTTYVKQGLGNVTRHAGNNVMHCDTLYNCQAPKRDDEYFLNGMNTISQNAHLVFDLICGIDLALALEEVGLLCQILRASHLREVW